MSSTSDVIVVGAGVFGLASAWELAKGGLSVTVLDRAPVGTEASGWALGRIDPLLKGSGSTGETEKNAPSGQLAKPETQQELALRSYKLHQDMMPEIESISGIDLQFDDQPTLQLLYSEKERESAASDAAKWTKIGFKTELVSSTEIASTDGRFRSTEFGGALVQGPYFIDSLSFVQALAVCARSRGVKLETATVSSIEQSGHESATVHTDQGHYEAKTVVVAAGPWSSPLVKSFGFDLPVHPSKGEILRMSVPSGSEFSLHLHGPCSLVNKKDGLAWVAATAAEAGFDRTPTQEAETKLLENARVMMVGASEWPVAQHTVCFRPATSDDLPVLGYVERNVIVASGGGGSGIVHCLTIGSEVAKMVTSGEQEPATASIALSRFGN